MFATSLVWTPSHMRASIRALYSFYLHLERGRSSRWERNCQRNSAADEKLFITSHGGEGVYNFRRGLDLGVNFENPQNVIGVEILRHGTGIPCKCCQTTFCLKQKQKNFTRTELLRPLYWIASVKPTGLPPMHLASSRTRVQTEITAMVQFIRELKQQRF